MWPHFHKTAHRWKSGPHLQWERQTDIIYIYSTYIHKQVKMYSMSGPEIFTIIKDTLVTWFKKLHPYDPLKHQLVLHYIVHVRVGLVYIQHEKKNKLESTKYIRSIKTNTYSAIWKSYIQLDQIKHCWVGACSICMSIHMCISTNVVYNGSQEVVHGMIGPHALIKWVAWGCVHQPRWSIPLEHIRQVLKLKKKWNKSSACLKDQILVTTNITETITNPADWLPYPVILQPQTVGKRDLKCLDVCIGK